MERVPFKVSARAARLIGRENVSNAEAAVIELVKNGYDADANSCVVFIDNFYPDIPKTLSESEFREINTQFIKLDEFYIEDGKQLSYTLRDDLEDLTELYEYFMSFNNVYILDDGTGMSKDIILNHWMTIGTNNKENNYFSDNGRIRTGAKGIGRFALDRLGSSCQMWTLEQNSEKGHHWNVMWEDFESTNAIID
ncbi:ATP-binding protein, partial [Micrococcus luteus]